MPLKRISPSDIPFLAFVYLAVIFSAVAVTVPILYVLANSFSTSEEAASRGFYLFPHEWTLHAYRYLLINENFVTAFGNAVFITVFGTIINIVLTTLMAYSLSKRWLKGRRIFNLMVLFAMLFSGGIIPTYLVVRELGIINTYWAVWLVGAIAPFNLIVMRSFFQNLPEELEEAARMDGCSEWRLLLSIALPLSTPAIATFTLFYLVQNWNVYFQAILYLNDSSKWPLQVFLRQMLVEASDISMQASAGEFQYGPPVKMAAVMITAAPLLIVYPFLQKYFAQGLLLGSVKG